MPTDTKSVEEIASALSALERHFLRRCVDDVVRFSMYDKQAYIPVYSMVTKGLVHITQTKPGRYAFTITALGRAVVAVVEGEQ